MTEPGPQVTARRAVDLVFGESGPTDLLVICPGGWGATTALAEVAVEADRRGLPVATVKGRRLEGDRELGVLGTLLGLPSGTESDREGHLVAELVESGPFLVVDDGHWLDAGSVRVLTGWVERTADHQGCLVVAHRPGVGSAPVGALDAELTRRQPPWRMGPWTGDALAAALADLTGGPVTDAFVDEIFDLTAGVPVYTAALVEAWLDAGLVDPSRPPDDRRQVPGRVADLVAGRVAELSADDRRLLLVLALAPAMPDAALGAAADLDPATLPVAVDRLRAAGFLVAGHDEAVPLVARVIAAEASAAEVRSVHSRLADALSDTPARAAEHLVAAGSVDGAAATILVAAADQVLADDPATAVAWLDHAARAGASAAEVAVGRAEAALLEGRVTDALAATDLVAHDAEARARASTVAARALSHRGLLDRAAATRLAIADHPRLPDRHFRLLAVPGLVATGQGEKAQEVWAEFGAAGDRGSLVTDAATKAAEGALAALGDDPARALAAWGESAELLEALPASVTQPDSPHATGALVAAAAARLSVATDLAERALRHDVGGPLDRDRHQLVLGWVALRSGDWSQAAGALGAVDGELSPPLALIHGALRTGLARRSGDVGGLTAAWQEAQRALDRQPAELFTLAPRGELAVTAARLGHRDRADAAFLEMSELLGRLGDPPLFVAPLGWDRLQAAVAADDHESITREASRLSELSGAVPARLAGVLPAAQTWAAVVGGLVDPDEVGAAAHGLLDAGLVWDASRLVGQAAIRVDDPPLARSLLERARALKAELPEREADSVPGASVLSEREQEVGALVADGLTYKEIGAQLYISPKTVEHHVAKIREKLGASTRAEMLAALRA